MTQTEWHICRGRIIDLSTPAVMAILNVTPDSFSDGGELPTPEAAADRAADATECGATLLDIGGESTRPGAARVDADEQIRRVVPAIREIATRLADPIISVDTTLSRVAWAAIDAGASIVNDVSAGTEDPDMPAVVAASGAGFIAMHRHAPPDRDSYSDAYVAPPIDGDAVHAVCAYLRHRLASLEASGIPRDRVLLDPGLGFGKTVEQNMALIDRTPELVALGRPVLSALSNKSFVGRVSLRRDSTPQERLAGTIALTAVHRSRGASVFRVHDVRACTEALRSVDGATNRAF